MLDVSSIQGFLGLCEELATDALPPPVGVDNQEGDVPAQPQPQQQAYVNERLLAILSSIKL